MTYSQQLRDRRWQRKRLEMLNRAQWRCQDPNCPQPDNDKIMLVVHHRVYHAGQMAWDYRYEDLQVLCEFCHRKVHGHPDEPAPNLTLGEFYAWCELRAFFGFMPSPYLTNAKGKIVCGAFRKDLNPDAPSIVLPGLAREHWAENAKLLCKQRQSIPVFTKEAGLPWEYHGLFKGEGFTQNQIEIEIHRQRASVRSEPIALVLFLQKVDE